MMSQYHMVLLLILVLPLEIEVKQIFAAFLRNRRSKDSFVKNRGCDLTMFHRLIRFVSQLAPTGKSSHVLLVVMESTTIQ